MNVEEGNVDVYKNEKLGINGVGKYELKEDKYLN